MTNKKILTITLSLTMIHFILTSVIGHYIAVQIGTQKGKIVAEGLIEAYEKSPQQSSQKSEEEATQIYQNMKSKGDNILESWEIPNLLISLPAKPLIIPLLKETKRSLMNSYISKDITREQFR